MPPSRKFRRSCVPGNLALNALDTGYAVRFEASSIVDWTELSQLFDQYRIDKVEYSFELLTPFLSGLPYPRVAIAPDYTDDTSAPLNETTVLALQGAKLFQFGPDKQRFTVTLKPKIAVSSYQSAVSSGYVIPDKQHWIACSGGDLVDHYGLKFYVSNYNSTISTLPVIRTFATYWISMRGMR
jgi:hypothetical protein